MQRRTRTLQISRSRPIRHLTSHRPARYERDSFPNLMTVGTARSQKSYFNFLLQRYRCRKYLAINRVEGFVRQRTRILHGQLHAIQTADDWGCSPTCAHVHFTYLFKDSFLSSWHKNMRVLILSICTVGNMSKSRKAGYTLPHQT
jgi:hypothetical protein